LVPLADEVKNPVKTDPNAAPKTAPKTATTVTELLGADHDRLDALFEAAERLAGSGEFFEALERFHEFRSGLERHIELEEKLLFPAFEQVTGMPSGPTAVMRSEHVEIKSLLEEIEQALRQEETSELLGSAGELKQLLGDHNAKEENALYPMTDRALGAGVGELVRAMAAF
jgi:hemerythrin-like domain-containing protein